MSEMFTIKPLRWEYSAMTQVARPLYGVSYQIREASFGCVEAFVWFGDSYVQLDIANTQDAAKLAAEAHWQDRIKQALVPVEVTQHDGSGQ